MIKFIAFDYENLCYDIEKFKIVLTIISQVKKNAYIILPKERYFETIVQENYTKNPTIHNHFQALKRDMVFGCGKKMFHVEEYERCLKGETIHGLQYYFSETPGNKYYKNIHTYFECTDEINQNQYKTPVDKGKVEHVSDEEIKKWFRPLVKSFFANNQNLYYYDRNILGNIDIHGEDNREWSILEQLYQSVKFINDICIEFNIIPQLTIISGLKYDSDLQPDIKLKITTKFLQKARSLFGKFKNIKILFEGYHLKLNSYEKSYIHERMLSNKIFYWTLDHGLHLIINKEKKIKKNL